MLLGIEVAVISIDDAARFVLDIYMSIGCCVMKLDAPVRVDIGCIQAF